MPKSLKVKKAEPDTRIVPRFKSQSPTGSVSLFRRSVPITYSLATVAVNRSCRNPNFLIASYPYGWDCFVDMAFVTGTCINFPAAVTRGPSGN